MKPAFAHVPPPTNGSHLICRAVESLSAAGKRAVIFPCSSETFSELFVFPISDGDVVAPDEHGRHQGRHRKVRLRWNYRPDSDLYVIYTAGQSFCQSCDVNPPEFYQNKLAIKFTYSWRP